MSLYVFVKANMSSRLLNYIKNLPSCAAVLATGNELSTMTDDEVEDYKKQCLVTEMIYKGCKIVKKENPYINEINILKGIEEKVETENFDDVNKRIKIINNIYNNESIVRNQTKNKVLIHDRINFNALNIELLLRLLNKYSLSKDFLNLNIENIKNINSQDLEKLKSLIAEVKNSSQSKKKDISYE